MTAEINKELENITQRFLVEVTNLLASKVNPPNPVIEEDQILNVEEVCKMLNISRSALYKYMREGRIPCRKIGRDNRFIKSEIIKSLKLVV